MRRSILAKLIRAHLTGAEADFRKAALQLAAQESKAGHTRIAQEIREIVAQLPETTKSEVSSVVSLARPSGDLADLLEGGYREERLREIVLEAEKIDTLKRVLRENKNRGEIESWGVTPRRKLLFYGPPGCGKTLAARVIAGELGLPLMTVRFDGLFSRFLGATANHLKAIFDEMPRRQAVYLFDEFDAVGKQRGDQQDVGEVRRVVTSFLQLMDADRSSSVVIAATNYEEILDHAVFRRFDLLLPFTRPDPDRLRALLELRLGAFRMPKKTLTAAAKAADGLSAADVCRACDDAIRRMALEGQRVLSGSDLLASVESVRSECLRFYRNS